MKTRLLAGVAGLLGGIACSTAMTLAALGIAGAVAAGGAEGMAGMRSPRSRGASTSAVLAFVLDHGPAILVASALLVVLSLIARKRSWQRAILAALAGALMYWGMYVQADVTVMYAAMAIGLGAWAALLLSARRRSVGSVSKTMASR